MSTSKREGTGEAVVASTPLVSLPAVSLDTETTGLDTTLARVVQIGAIGMLGSQIEADRAFETLVNPGVPIPAATSAIHGIRDGDVQDAPTVDEAIPRLSAFLGAYLGRKWLEKITLQTVRYIVSALLLAVGVGLVSGLM